MKETTGSNLFTGYRATNSWFKRLDLLLHEECDVLRLTCERDAALWERKLLSKFLLHPVFLHTLDDVSVSSAKRPIKTKSGDLIYRHVAAAHVPYSGSRRLLQISPVQGFKFPYRGTPRKQTVLVKGLLHSLDLTDFVADVSVEIDRVREALHEGGPQVERFNEQVRAAVTRKIANY